jgi:hypothetical protein
VTLLRLDTVAPFPYSRSNMYFLSFMNQSRTAGHQRAVEEPEKGPAGEWVLPRLMEKRLKGRETGRRAE